MRLCFIQLSHCLPSDPHSTKTTLTEKNHYMEFTQRPSLLVNENATTQCKTVQCQELAVNNGTEGQKRAIYRTSVPVT